MNILEEIAEKTRERIQAEKGRLPLRELRRQAEEREGRLHAFRDALKGPGLSFICEVKKASPSKGVIAREFPYLDIAREYEMAGASAISVGTANFHDPGVSAKIVDGIEKYMERQGFESVADMVGIVR